MHLEQSNDGDKAFGGQGLQNRPWTFLGFSSAASRHSFGSVSMRSLWYNHRSRLVLALPGPGALNLPILSLFKILFSPSWHLIHLFLFLKHCIEILSTLMTEFFVSLLHFVPHLPHPHSNLSLNPGLPCLLHSVIHINRKTVELTPSPGSPFRQAFDSVMARGEPAVHFRAARSFNRERPERIEATRE